MKYLMIIKKMNLKIKKISYLLFTLIVLSGCQSVKEGLTGKKQNNSDEFLVQKKNPLILPPEFEKLPEPGSLKKDNDNSESKIDLTKVLEKDSTSSRTVSNGETSNGSLEKSILEKIKSN